MERGYTLDRNINMSYVQFREQADSVLFHSFLMTLKAIVKQWIQYLQEKN